MQLDLNFSLPLKQGHLLSSYIFILRANNLSTLLNKYVNLGWIKPFKFRESAPPLSQLLFADDARILGQVDSDNLDWILSLLQSFSKASRLSK